MHSLSVHLERDLCNVPCVPVFTLCKCCCLVLIAKQEVHVGKGIHQGLLEGWNLVAGKVIRSSSSAGVNSCSFKVRKYKVL